MAICLFEKNLVMVFKNIYKYFEDFESLINNTISHFVAVNDYRHAYKYSLLLANYFHKEKKYKKAASNFSIANYYLSKQENRNFIEDI